MTRRGSTVRIGGLMSSIATPARLARAVAAVRSRYGVPHSTRLSINAKCRRCREPVVVNVNGGKVRCGSCSCRLAPAEKRLLTCLTLETLAAPMPESAIRASLRVGARKPPKSTKRTRLKNATGKWYAKRGKDGRFTSLDDIGRSLAADRRKKAKRKVPSGYGDQGDR